MTIQELNKVLELHKKWLNNKPDGVRANFDFKDFRGADLYGANLRGANLYEADLYKANLCGANLRETIFYQADLRGANLYGADLRGVKNIPFIPMVCPEIGSYIAFKKADGLIIVLEISEDALRSSATTRMCRASKAKVLRIENLDESISSTQEVRSDYDSTFIYKVGETVEVRDFDTNRWEECSTGIHHFMSRQEAVEYFSNGVANMTLKKLSELRTPTSTWTPEENLNIRKSMAEQLITLGDWTLSSGTFSMT